MSSRSGDEPGVAVGLAHAGMKVQDAFNSGLTVALLPVVATAILAGIYWCLSIMRF